MGYTRAMETTAGTVEAGREGSTPIFDELVGRFGIELPTAADEDSAQQENERATA